MTKLLEKGIEAARALPAERQDAVGELLLSLADQSKFRLTAEQVKDLEQSVAEADRNEFASQREIAESWKKFGL